MDVFQEGDIVHMDDQTKGEVLFVYKFKEVAVVEIDGSAMNIPLDRLSKTKFKIQEGT